MLRVACCMLHVALCRRVVTLEMRIRVVRLVRSVRLVMMMVMVMKMTMIIMVLRIRMMMKMVMIIIENPHSVFRWVGIRDTQLPTRTDQSINRLIDRSIERASERASERAWRRVLHDRQDSYTVAVSVHTVCRTCLDLDCVQSICSCSCSCSRSCSHSLSLEKGLAVRCALCVVRCAWVW